MGCGDQQFFLLDVEITKVFDRQRIQSFSRASEQVSVQRKRTGVDLNMLTTGVQIIDNLPNAKQLEAPKVDGSAR